MSKEWPRGQTTRRASRTRGRRQSRTVQSRIEELASIKLDLRCSAVGAGELVHLPTGRDLLELDLLPDVLFRVGSFFLVPAGEDDLRRLVRALLLTGAQAIQAGGGWNGAIRRPCLLPRRMAG